MNGNRTFDKRQIEEDLVKLGVSAPHSLYNYLRLISSKTGPDVVSPFAGNRTSEELAKELETLLRKVGYYNRISELGLATEAKERDLFRVTSDVPPLTEKVFAEEMVPNKSKLDHEGLSWAKMALTHYLFGTYRPNFRPATVDAAEDSLIRNTNSGLPWFSRRSEVRREARELAAKALRSEIDPSMNMYVVGRRSKPSDEGTEQRIIYMASYAANIVEKAVVLPIVTALTSSPVFPYGGLPAINVKINDMLRQGLNFLSFDASRFDRNVSESQLLLARELVSGWFHPSSRYVVDLAFSFMLNAKVVLPWGIVDKPFGVKSGSGLTNLVDSLLNLLALADHTGHSDSYVKQLSNTIVNGDDMITPFLFRDTQQLEDYYKANFSWFVNGQKQWISKTDALFSGHLYRFERGKFEWYRPFWRFARGMFFPERAHRVGSLGETLIAISKLHTLETNPAFKETVNHIMMLDRRYMLGTISKETMGKVLSPSNLNLVKESLRLDRDDVMATTTLKGIKGWKVTRYLQSLI